MATFTTGSAPSYADCVSSLRTSLSYLESSVLTLGTGVEDFPRLINVLKTVRVRHIPFSSALTGLCGRTWANLRFHPA